jgi:multiple sugar transport system permease protein
MRGSARRHEALTGLLMLAPVLLAVLVLRLWPALIAIGTSLSSDAPHGSVDLSAYHALFVDQTFRDSLLVTALFSIIVNPLQIALALLLALLFVRNVPAVGLWRTLVVLPVVIPQSVSSLIWGIAFRPDGLLNGLLSAAGLPQQPFLTSTQQALPGIMLVVSWVGIGYWMLFLVAGLQDIPPSLHEAAKLDGARAWQSFRFITLPLLRRPLLFVIVADTIANFLVFAPVQILTNGGPQGTTNLIMLDIYTRAFVYGDNRGAAAETVVLVAAVLAVVLVQFRLMRTAT